MVPLGKIGDEKSGWREKKIELGWYETSTQTYSVWSLPAQQPVDSDLLVLADSPGTFAGLTIYDSKKKCNLMKHMNFKNEVPNLKEISKNSQNKTSQPVEGFQSGSKMMIRFAPMRLTPNPPTFVVSRKMNNDSSWQITYRNATVDSPLYK